MKLKKFKTVREMKITFPEEQSRITDMTTDFSFSYKYLSPNRMIIQNILICHPHLRWHDTSGNTTVFSKKICFSLFYKSEYGEN